MPCIVIIWSHKSQRYLVLYREQYRESEKHFLTMLWSCLCLCQCPPLPPHGSSTWRVGRVSAQHVKMECVFMAVCLRRENRCMVLQVLKVPSEPCGRQVLWMGGVRMLLQMCWMALTVWLKFGSQRVPTRFSGLASRCSGHWLGLRGERCGREMGWRCWGTSGIYWSHH